MTAVNRFINNHREALKCHKRSDATYLNMMGGKFQIGDDLIEPFLRAYSDDMRSARVLFSEIVTEVAPFFIDVDFFDPNMSLKDANSDEFGQKVADWCQAVIQELAKVSVAEGAQEDITIDEILGKTTVTNTKLLRDTMSCRSAVLAQAPPRTVTKKDVQGTKVGLHLLWPNLLVTKATAQRLQGVVTATLYDMSPEFNWDDIIDLAVYRPVASLRMLHSFKFKRCADCKPQDAKNNAVLRQTFWRLIYISPPCCC